MNTVVEQAWREHAAGLLAFLRRRTGGNQALAQDLLQECFLRLQRQREAPALVRAWLYRSAANLTIDHYRVQRPSVPLSDSLPADEGDEGQGDWDPLLACLPSLLDGLPKVYRQALRRTDLQGGAQQELADEQGLSLSGAKSRVQRARRLLRQAYERCCALEYDAGGRVTGFREPVSRDFSTQSCVFFEDSSS